MADIWMRDFLSKDIKDGISSISLEIEHPNESLACGVVLLMIYRDGEQVELGGYIRSEEDKQKILHELETVSRYITTAVQNIHDMKVGQIED